MRILFAVSIALLTASVAHAQPSVAVQANNDFTFRLLQQLSKEKPGENVFVSPWSISSALAMTMEGARNQTALEMGHVLGLPKELKQTGERPWNMDPYHKGFADLQKRCTPMRDAAKDDATRKKIVELKKELETLNKKLQSPGKDYNDLYTKAHHLATTINDLQKQVDLYELNVANAIWGEKTYPFDPAFSERVGSFYGSGLVRQADFINSFPAERAKINQWVENQTKNKIKDLVPEIPPEIARAIRMILVNAIYFKGQWSDPFDPKHTKPGAFKTADGGSKQTPLMVQHMPARYAAFDKNGVHFDTPRNLGFGGKKVKEYPDDDGFQMVELPYKGKRLSMLVIAPRDPKGLPAIEAKLTGTTLAAWASKLESFEVRVTLPKFKMETTYELRGPLVKLGMVDAFDDEKADFKGMTKSSNPRDRLFISRVIHKAFADVNEEGTEAAAATAVIMMVPLSARPVPFIPEFRADRPFLFLIREVDTGAVLFLGRMTTPPK